MMSELNQNKTFGKKFRERAKKGWETKAAEKTSAQQAKIASDRQKTVIYFP
jgi:hypothetical protein